MNDFLQSCVCLEFMTQKTQQECAHVSVFPATTEHKGRAQGLGVAATWSVRLQAAHLTSHGLGHTRAASRVSPGSPEPWVFFTNRGGVGHTYQQFLVTGQLGEVYACLDHENNVQRV